MGYGVIYASIDFRRHSIVSHSSTSYTRLPTPPPLSNLRTLFDLLLKLHQSLHHLPSHKICQTQSVKCQHHPQISRSQCAGVYSHPLPRNNPIRPAILPPLFPRTKPPIPIHLHTSKNILRPRNPPIIRWIPQITDMYPSTVSRSSSATLVIRAARAVIWLR